MKCAAGSEVVKVRRVVVSEGTVSTNVNEMAHGVRGVGQANYGQ